MIKLASAGPTEFLPFAPQLSEKSQPKISKLDAAHPTCRRQGRLGVRPIVTGARPAANIFAVPAPFNRRTLRAS